MSINLNLTFLLVIVAMLGAITIDSISKHNTSIEMAKLGYAQVVQGRQTVWVPRQDPYKKDKKGQL